MTDVLALDERFVPALDAGRIVVTYAVARQRYVKIGRTSMRQFDQRMRALSHPTRTGVKIPDGMDLRARLTLVRLFPYDIEATLHERYAASRVAGEWFEDQIIPDLFALDVGVRLDL